MLTERLALSRPSPDDVDGLYAICRDPRVWEHFPSLRHTSPAQTRSMINGWSRSWDAVGLGVWVVRLGGDQRVIGYGGCSDLHETVWNLGYRIAVATHGHGYATELARVATRQAHQLKPVLPVVAYLLEHNVASERVARKLGMRLVHRGADAGNLDSSAVRLVYAERTLSPAELTAATT